MRRLIILVCSAIISSAAFADVVTDWNAAAYRVMGAAGVTGAPAARTLAIMHVAMADAVGAVQPRYGRYAYRGKPQPAASAEAAAASAARGALLALYPGQQKIIDETYAASIRSVPDGAGKNAGVALGAEAAAAVVGARADDATTVPDAYRPITTPGTWIPTTMPATPQYARAKPWGFDQPDRFRPGPPPALTSGQYARDYDETKTLGAIRSTQRSAEQSEAVKFWTQSNLGVAWHQAARQLAAARRLDLSDTARLFALLSMAHANTFIIDWDAKFHYNAWRPLTAIRNGDRDGNDATERDATWLPANATPMHPEYPSQAAIVAGSALAMLSALLRDPSPGPVTVVDSANPKLTRTFATINALAEEQGMVRIWGGIHFRYSLEASDKMGRALVAYLLETAYRPMH